MSQKLSDEIFDRYAVFINDRYGIKITRDKKDMFDLKLKKVMTAHAYNSYDEFLNVLMIGKQEDVIREFMNEITINKTDFFREINHFNFMKAKLEFILSSNKNIMRNKEIRVWSSASSTGEEPYTLAMVLKEILPPDITIKILATDISSKVLRKAVEGVYPSLIAGQMSQYYLDKYFYKEGFHYRVSEELRSVVTFRLFNLMEPFPFKNKFDIIFCRNVMIYFDNDTQEKLVAKFYDSLHKGALLFIGHSESLSYKKHSFKYVQPTIYQK